MNPAAWLRRSAAVLCAAAAVVALTPASVQARTVPPSPPARGANPVLLLPATGFTPGETVVVRGSGWSRGPVNLQLCGNGGVGGSPSCHMPSSRTAQANDAGDFAIQFQIAAPPRPCPCVLIARGLATEERAVSAVGVVGHPVVEGTPIKEPQAANTTLSFTVSLRGERSWGDYFGTGPKRQLSLRVTNTGRYPTGAGSVDVSVGKEFPPTGFGQVVNFDSIAPGETQVIEAEVTLDAFAYGDYWVAAVLHSPRAEAATGTTTASFPSGLLASVVVLVLLFDLRVVRRVRRRAKANRAALAAAAASLPEDGTPASTLRPRQGDAPAISIMPAAFPIMFDPPAPDPGSADTEPADRPV